MRGRDSWDLGPRMFSTKALTLNHYCTRLLDTLGGFGGAAGGGVESYHSGFLRIMGLRNKHEWIKSSLDL